MSDGKWFDKRVGDLDGDRDHRYTWGDRGTTRMGVKKSTDTQGKQDTRHMDEVGKTQMR